MSYYIVTKSSLKNGHVVEVGAQEAGVETTEDNHVTVGWRRFKIGKDAFLSLDEAKKELARLAKNRLIAIEKDRKILDAVCLGEVSVIGRDESNI